MLSSLRQSLTWLHTWFGLVLGFVLMVVFFFGSLSVFDREIDRWANPSSRFEPQIMPSYDRVLGPIFAGLKPEEEELDEAERRIGKRPGPDLPVMNYSAYTTHRDPVLSLYSEFKVDNPDDATDHVHGHVTIDPRNGTSMPHDELKIGSKFFYPMHFSLHLHWLDLGYWLVGAAALVMLAALVSGVVMHRKLFRELFTFRPQKSTQRSSLDLHNLTGVLALPFHFMFPLTGLVIFAGIYFPVAETTLAPVARAHEEAEARAKGLPFAPAGKPAKLASVDAMVAVAKEHWRARDMPGEVGYLNVAHVGDENSYVSIFRAGSDRVSLVGQGVHFSGTTGKVLYEEPPPTAISGINEFLTGLHLQHFEHWPLRWLYVLGGLSGCVCIATGLVFFVGKRKRKHASQGVSGARWVDALAVTTVTGMVIATLTILIANRALPAELEQRGDWEERCFWGAWLLSLAHAAWRSAPVLQARLSPAWREQCWAIAVLAPSAVLLNWLTTGDHLLRTIGEGYWPVAGLDLALIAVTAVAASTARKLRQRELGPTSEPEADDERGARATPEAAHG